MKLKMRVQGIDAMEAVVREVPRREEKAIRQNLDVAAELLVGEIKEELSGPGGARKLHVRSGFLRGSWHRERVDKDTRRVLSTAPYNLIHELGGPIKRGGRVVGTMPERPFLRPAIRTWSKPAEKQWGLTLGKVNREMQTKANRIRRGDRG